LSLALRAAQADPAAWSTPAGSHRPAPPAEERETWCGGSLDPRQARTRGQQAAPWPRHQAPHDGARSLGDYLYSSRVSVACGQQLDWRGVRHTRESCGDADPSGHLREFYAPLISMKSTSDLDRDHMPWDCLEHDNSMSPFLSRQQPWLRQTSSLMTTPFNTPPVGEPYLEQLFCGQQLDWRGVSHTRECEPADTKCRYRECTAPMSI